MVETERFERAMSWLICLNKAEELFSENDSEKNYLYLSYLYNRMSEYILNIQQCGYDVEYSVLFDKYKLVRRDNGKYRSCKSSA